MLVALFGAHPTDLFANHEIFFRDLRVPLHEPGGLEADVSAVAVEFNTTGEQGDVLFIETGRFTFFTHKRAVYQFLNQFLVVNISIP